MKVTVLGCGNAFSIKNGNSCFLLEDEKYTSFSDNVHINMHGKTNQQRMLIDAGWALPYMLERNKVDINSITDVYISHSHSDHAGGIEYLGFSRYDWINKPQRWDGFKMGSAPTLIANSKLMADLWDHSLSGGMSSLEDVDAKLDTFFNCQPILPNQTFEWCGWTCKLIQQIHIMTGTVITNTFGLFMEKPEHQSIYFVTDSQHCSPKQIQVFYQKADAIFQDCECIGVDTKLKESKFMSGVHANYAQLAGWKGANSTELSENVRSKMHLSHYQDFVSDGKDMFGNTCDWDALAAQDKFAGFVKVGQVYEF